MGFYVSGGGEGSIGAKKVKKVKTTVKVNRQNQKTRLEERPNLYHGGLQVEPALDKTEGGHAKS
jgi:hypothetical protein